MRPGLKSGRFPVGPSRREGPIDRQPLETQPQERLSANSPFRQKGPTKTIGFLSRICPDKGLQLLCRRWHSIEQMPSAPSFRLRAAGYLDRADRRYLHDLYKQAPLTVSGGSIRVRRRIGPRGKIAFLESLDVFCLPSLLRESKGLPVLEAWACGVPAVLPDIGAFSELVADTGGGLLYDPQQPDELLSALPANLQRRRPGGPMRSTALSRRYTSGIRPRTESPGNAGTLRAAGAVRHRQHYVAL